MNLATSHLSSDVMMLNSFMGHHDDSLFCFEAYSRIGLAAMFGCQLANRCHCTLSPPPDSSTTNQFFYIFFLLSFSLFLLFLLFTYFSLFISCPLSYNPLTAQLHFRPLLHDPNCLSILFSSLSQRTQQDQLLYQLPLPAAN